FAARAANCDGCFIAKSSRTLAPCRPQVADRSEINCSVSRARAGRPLGFPDSPGCHRGRRFFSEASCILLLSVVSGKNGGVGGANVSTCTMRGAHACSDFVFCYGGETMARVLFVATISSIALLPLSAEAKTPNNPMAAPGECADVLTNKVFNTAEYKTDTFFWMTLFSNREQKREEEKSSSESES